MIDLRELRKLKGVTIEIVAKAIGVSKSFYCRIEQKGLPLAKEETCRKIADYFGVSVFLLLGEGFLRFAPRNDAEWKQVRKIARSIANNGKKET